jgi:hypothetical protein
MFVVPSLTITFLDWRGTNTLAYFIVAKHKHSSLLCQMAGLSDRIVVNVIKAERSEGRMRPESAILEVPRHSV